MSFNELIHLHFSITFMMMIPLSEYQDCNLMMLGDALGFNGKKNLKNAANYIWMVIKKKLIGRTI